MNSTTAPPTTPPRPPGVAEPSGFAASAAALYEDLVADGATSHVGTPCGILAPLWTQAENDPRVTLTTISREDTALAFAAGQALAGGRPVVLMQNSGFGSCVNVMASLVCAFELPVTLVVSLRGTGVDHTAENRGMGAVTRTLLDAWHFLRTFIC